MTKREQLQEKYEDALFALMMDEFAMTEGKKALEENERLKRDSNFVVPPEVERRCLKAISQYCTKQSIHTVGKVFSRIVSKVAIVALVGMLLFTTAFAASPTFRATTLNLVVQMFDDRTVFKMEANTQLHDESSFQYQITAKWLPEGYLLDRQEADSRGVENIYEAPNGHELIIAVLSLSSGAFNVDTEDAEVQKLQIENHDVLRQKDDLTQLVWADEDKGVFVNIRSEMAEKDNMIKIAENLLVEEIS